MNEPRSPPSETDDAIGARLRERREAIGLGPDDLAAACGLSVAQVLRYEAGAEPLTATQLCTLADLLEVPLTYFHRPAFAHVGLSGMDSGDLLELFGRLSLPARRQVASLALQLADEPPAV